VREKPRRQNTRKGMGMTELKEKKVERLRETAGKTLWAEFDGFSLFPTKDKKKLVAVQSVNCTCASLLKTAKK
jgi:hypothetical protein